MALHFAITPRNPGSTLTFLEVFGGNSPFRKQKPPAIPNGKGHHRRQLAPPPLVTEPFFHGESISSGLEGLTLPCPRLHKDRHMTQA